MENLTIGNGMPIGLLLNEHGGTNKLAINLHSKLDSRAKFQRFLLSLQIFLQNGGHKTSLSF